MNAEDASSLRRGGRSRRAPLKLDTDNDNERLMAQAMRKSLLETKRVEAAPVEAPVFHPTLEQLNDPLRYFASISDIGHSAGIVKIVTPPEWRPSFQLDMGEQSFMTKRQLLHSLQEGLAFDEGYQYTQAQYRAVAENFDKEWGSRHPDMQARLQATTSAEEAAALLEKEYWRIVERVSQELVAVDYASDIHTQHYESAFGKLTEQRQWDLNTLRTLRESLLSQVGSPIEGLTKPWLYFGMKFATFCWHTEDHFLYSINYHHTGAPKTWYGIPSSNASRFEELLQASLPLRFQEDRDLLHQLVAMLPPGLLLGQGVPVRRTLQQPGDLILTFPRAYHAGFSHGWNCAEATNFALCDWLPYGRTAVEKYGRGNAMRPTVFSHDRLLWDWAQLLAQPTKVTSEPVVVHPPPPSALAPAAAAAGATPLVPLQQQQQQMVHPPPPAASAVAAAEATPLLPLHQQQQQHTVHVSLAATQQLQQPSGARHAAGGGSGMEEEGKQGGPGQVAVTARLEVRPAASATPAAPPVAAPAAVPAAALAAAPSAATAAAAAQQLQERQASNAEAGSAGATTTATTAAATAAKAAGYGDDSRWAEWHQYRRSVLRLRADSVRFRLHAELLPPPSAQGGGSGAQGGGSGAEAAAAHLSSLGVSPSDLQVVHAQLLTLVKDELAARDGMRQHGARLCPAGSGHAPHGSAVDEKLSCCVCKGLPYLSYVTCKCLRGAPRCMQHAVPVGCGCTSREYTVVYQPTEQEMMALAFRLWVMLPQALRGEEADVKSPPPLQEKRGVGRPPKRKGGASDRGGPKKGRTQGSGSPSGEREGQQPPPMLCPSVLPGMVKAPPGADPLPGAKPPPPAAIGAEGQQQPMQSDLANGGGTAPPTGDGALPTTGGAQPTATIELSATTANGNTIALDPGPGHISVLAAASGGKQQESSPRPSSADAVQPGTPPGAPVSASPLTNVAAADAATAAPEGAAGQQQQQPVAAAAKPRKRRAPAAPAQPRAVGGWRQGRGGGGSCTACGRGVKAGSALQCVACDCAYHASCVPSEVRKPSGDMWLCEFCVMAQR